MRLILSATLFICAVPVGLAAAACNTDRRQPTASAEAVLSIRLDQTQVKPGVTAVLHIQLTNASKRPLTVIGPSGQRELEIHIVDSHGAEPSLTELGKNLRGKGRAPAIASMYEMTIAPEEAVKADADIAQIYSLTVPGDYRVTVCRVVVELGPVLSNAVNLTVRPQ